MFWSIWRSLSWKMLVHLPPLTGLMDTKQALLSQAVVQVLQRGQIGVFVFMTGLARVGHLGIIQRIFGQQGHKRMRVIISGFGALGDSGHVAADAVAKRMDGMGHLWVNHLVAHQALLRAGAFGLKLGRGHTQLMDIVAGGAGDAFFGVGGKLPAEILLMVPFGEIFCVNIFKVSVIVTFGLVVDSQGPAGLITHRPFDTLYLGRRAAGVA